MRSFEVDSLRSCGMLRGFGMYFVTDVSGQPIGPMLKEEFVQEEISWTS
jgi:hypothetical protein